MTLLLDTHVLLWWLGDPDRLGPRTRAALTTTPRVQVSVVSGLEIAIKVSVGKLQAPSDLLDELPGQGFGILPLRWSHAATLARLPMHHHDPFDRMLVAQASTDGLRLVTADNRLTAYDVDLLDART